MSCFRVGWAEHTQWAPTCYSLNNTPYTYRVLSALELVSEAVGREQAQVALRWLLQKRAVPSIVIGARTMEQLMSNLQSVTFSLSHEHMAILDAASDNGMPYPYNLEQRYGSSRNR